MKALLVGIALFLGSCSDDHPRPSCEQAACECAPGDPGTCPDGFICDVATDTCEMLAPTADAALPIPDAGAAHD